MKILTVDMKCSTFSPRKSFTPKKSVGETKVPMYFAVLFHELREVDAAVTSKMESDDFHDDLSKNLETKENSRTQAQNWGVNDVIGKFWSENHDDDNFDYL
jgi:hypothetical protein